MKGEYRMISRRENRLLTLKRLSAAVGLFLLFSVISSHASSFPLQGPLLVPENQDEAAVQEHQGGSREISLAAVSVQTDVRETAPYGELSRNHQEERLVAQKSEGDSQGKERGKENETDRAVSEEFEEGPQIPDPFIQWNTFMFNVNDKLYFWLLKPATQVYSHIIPEDFRIVINNFYDNLWAPGRIINNLLQLRMKAAGNELIRFVFNSFAGIGGLGDMAKEALGIERQKADFGQTLGRYGVEHGFYVIWPVFGPSSLRDTIGLVGDRFMYPLSYISSNDLSFGAAAGIYGHELTNKTSFKIGDYETFKESAIDPYVSMRDAFVQSREKDIKESRR